MVEQSYDPLIIVCAVADLYHYSRKTDYCDIKKIQQKVLRRVHKIAKKRVSPLSCLRVCLSVSVEQLDSHWTYFYKILYLSVSRNSVDRIQVSLKSKRITGTLLEKG